MPNLTKAQRWAQEELFKQGKKRCTKCDEIKSISEFGPSKTGWRNLRSTCKECNRDYLKDWHNKNPDYMKFYLRQWRTKNPEKEAAQTKRWRKKNPDYFKIRGRLNYQLHKKAYRKTRRRYYQAHKEEFRERRRRWRAENPDKAKAIKVRHRTRKTNAGGSFTAEEWQALCKKYDNCCLCCGEVKPLTIDHIIPISEGGSSDIENIQPLCRSCNASKGTQTIDYR